MIVNAKEQIAAMSLSASGSIRDAMQAIDRGTLGTALLIEPQTGCLAGLVTDGDIRRALLAGHGMESPVAAVPRPEPKTARAGMSAEDITALFSQPVRVVPLLDEASHVVDLAVFDQRARLPVAAPWLGEKELQYVAECVLSGWVSSAGKFVTRFEEMFAQFCGTRYAVATSNGTTALHLAMLAAGIGPGDEVVVPSLTFIATANAVTYTGAQPVFVDSELGTWNMDPGLIEAAITPRTKAIVPVHLYGHPADMDPIVETAARHGLTIVEDAAEAHGARYKGRRVGSIGAMGIFSFYGNKIITTGEGGMVVTDRDDLAEKVRILRDHGMSPQRRYWHPFLGYNYRMTNMQAALGVAQMEKVDDILRAKRQMAARYRQGLDHTPGITLPPEAEWAENIFWLYSILVDSHQHGVTRDQLMNALQEQAIETRPLFPPIHQQPIYARQQSLPVAEMLSQTGLSLPSAVMLRADDIDRVTGAINRVIKES